MTGLAQHDHSPLQVEKQQNGNTIIQGLTQAVELFCQPTTTQLSAKERTEESGTTVVKNNGRIICLTHLNRYIMCY